jgi:hypothetical protein
VTDVDLRFHLPPQCTRIATAPYSLVAGGSALLFILGIFDTLLTTNEDAHSENDTIQWILLLILVTVVSTVSFLCVRGVASRDEDAEALGVWASIAIAFVCLVIVTVAFVAGNWVPFLAGWGGRTVREFEEAADGDVGDILRIYVYLGGMLSVVMAICVGLLAWLSQYTSKLPEWAAKVPWPWRIGLGVPLLLGAALALGALISSLSDGYKRPDTLEAGGVAEFPEGAPRLFEEEDIWLVRLTDAEFVALYDRGLESGCPLQWRREFESIGRRGWFVDACTGSAYDLTGRCFSDVCRGAQLDRFAISVEGDNVTVDLRVPERGLHADPNATPANPRPE